MTKLFTKTLIAASLLSAMGAASAANLVVPANPVGVSKQGAALTVNLNANAGDIRLTTAANYTEGYELTVTISAGELTVAPSQLVMAGGTAVTTGGGASDVTTEGVTWDKVSATPTSVVYRLNATAGDFTHLDAGAEIDFDGFQISGSSARAASSITMTVAPKADTGVAVDPATTGQSLSRLILRSADQFVAEFEDAVVSKKIDLSKGRKAFEGTGTAVYRFSLPVDLKNLNVIPAAGSTPASATIASVATMTNVEYTVTGDFSWINDSDANAPGIQAKAGTVVFGADCLNGAVSSITTTSLVVTCGLVANDSAADVHDITFDIRQDTTGTTVPNAIADGSYAVTAKVNYSAGTGTALTVATAKTVTTLTNNGTTIAVDYMPYQAGTISQILYVTNKTSQIGKIYVTARNEEGVKVADRVEVAMTKANGITEISGPVRAAIGDAYVGKVALSIDIESSSATVFAAYNVNGDRLATK